MKWFDFYTSSIGQKSIVSSTGLLLTAFLIVHLGLNATIFAADDGVLFDRIADLLRHSWWLHLLELLVLGSSILHIWQGAWLTIQNRSKRSHAYAVSAPWTIDPGRWMGVLGSIILAFLLLHLYQFWLPNAIGIGGNAAPSLYQIMEQTFSQGWVVAIYLVGCGALAAHLLHGWRSAAITWGVEDRYLRLLSPIGISLAIIVPLGLAVIPVALLTGWLIHA